ncbi:MAG: hypothetical protein PHP75_07490, partial [Methylacidiphilaceae bacterium]|nr:hypothetical protein [Candidatus Methylacidiphilaceae bacterium]
RLGESVSSEMQYFDGPRGGWDVLTRADSGIKARMIQGRRDRPDRRNGPWTHVSAPAVGIPLRPLGQPGQSMKTE